MAKILLGTAPSLRWLGYGRDRPSGIGGHRFMDRWLALEGRIAVKSREIASSRSYES